MRIILLIFILVAPCSRVVAQKIGTMRDSLRIVLKDEPSFSIFRDNYAVIGLPLNATPNKYNSNIKYQISFKQRLTNAVLPLNSFLFLTYTQKAFWDIFATSKPFAELNYNPSVGAATPVFKDGKLIGVFSLMLEHESNGRDSIFSRSWNFVSLSYDTSLSDKWKMMARVWIPFGWRSDNPDLMKNIGYGEVKFTWLPLNNNRLIADVTLRKGASLSWKGSMQTNVAYKLSKDNNQYVGFQWYVGQGESLIEYDEFVNVIRFGLIIKAFNKGLY